MHKCFASIPSEVIVSGQEWPKVIGASVNSALGIRKSHKVFGLRGVLALSVSWRVRLSWSSLR
jgi:hypothetical protein